MRVSECRDIGKIRNFPFTLLKLSGIYEGSVVVLILANGRAKKANL